MTTRPPSRFLAQLLLGTICFFLGSDAFVPHHKQRVLVQKLLDRSHPSNGSLLQYDARISSSTRVFLSSDNSILDGAGDLEASGGSSGEAKKNLESRFRKPFFMRRWVNKFIEWKRHKSRSFIAAAAFALTMLFVSRETIGSYVHRQQTSAPTAEIHRVVSGRQHAKALMTSTRGGSGGSPG